MARYKAQGMWTEVYGGDNYAGFRIQEADCVDTHNGQVYKDGARRVVDTEGKPAVRGKGGTVPFFGEMAWADSERLANDLYWKARCAR